MKFAKIIKKYFKERILLLNSEEDNDKITPSERKLSYANLNEINNEEKDLRRIISSPNLTQKNRDFKLKKIILFENNKDHNYKARIDPYTIYFIIAINNEYIEKKYK